VGGRPLVPWLITLGLAVATFAGAWQLLESNEREVDGALLKSFDVPDEPRATLVDRIRASWVPGDLARLVLVLAGLALCAAGAWRAWRVEGLPVGALRRVALTLAILGASSLALGGFRARTHPRDSWSGTYVPVDHHAGQIGYEDVDGEAFPAGVLPLLLLGGVWLGLGALLGLLSLLYAPRAPREPGRIPPPRGALGGDPWHP